MAGGLLRGVDGIFLAANRPPIVVLSPALESDLFCQCSSLSVSINRNSVQSYLFSLIMQNKRVKKHIARLSIVYKWQCQRPRFACSSMLSEVVKGHVLQVDMCLLWLLYAYRWTFRTDEWPLNVVIMIMKTKNILKCFLLKWIINNFAGKLANNAKLWKRFSI